MAAEAPAVANQTEARTADMRTANQERAMQRGHMTFADAATLAESAEVGEMWLTHFNPAMTEPEEFLINATSIFPATTIGRDGMTTRLVFRPIREEVS